MQQVLRAGRDPGSNLGGVVEKPAVDRMLAAFGLQGVEDLMLLALPGARALAHPPISDFHVGSVGLEAETGNLVLGGNVEFPGTHLGTTVHGEGFVFTRAFSRGTTIRTIAIGEAHPCAHCRQYLSEFAATRNLTLIDPLGHRLTMAQLYPWPFDPDYLGETGAVPKARLWSLSVEDRLLREAGERAHTPYSKCPAAVVLTLADGSRLAGSAIESVAFNPTMGPLQAALIDLLAHGRNYSEIASAVLGTVRGGAVDYAASVGELLGRVAPQAKLEVIDWTP
ncbi:MAG: cytidine deaminase [Hyphomicrobiales bacterium]|nr:MAG: cytidine deaminase [Hyphomicrobiales bacterium]